MFKLFLKNLEKRIIKISAKEYKPVLFSFEWLLVIISLVYKTGSRLRLLLYQANILKSRQLPCFVISIGNIMAGGAGKTPMAIYLARLLLKMGKHPVVISRGYKGHLKADAKIAGDGKTVFLTAKQAGDEPYMMAMQKTFPVVVGKNRYKAGMLAIKELNPDVIILDDGFQHLKLKKDLNLLLFDHDKPLGNKRILPAGRLRETPAMSQNRTHAVLFTRSPKNSATNHDIKKSKRANYPDIIKHYRDIPYFKSSHASYLFKLIFSSKTSTKANSISKENINLDTLEILKGKNALLFSGIAKNSAFAKAIESIGCNILDHLEFNDHFSYKSSDIDMIKQKADSLNADIVVTTEKDWVKLDPYIEWNVDMAVISVNIEFEDSNKFESFLKHRMSQ